MSSKSKPPESITFFIDRSLGRKLVADALRSAGASVEVHDDHFAQNVDDPEWLAEVGKRAWIVLTKDEKIRSRKNELLAVKNNAVGMFVLTAGNITGQAMAAVFVSALRRMTRVIKGNTKPFIATVTRSGTLRKLHI